MEYDSKIEVLKSLMTNTHTQGKIRVQTFLYDLFVLRHKNMDSPEQRYNISLIPVSK